MNWLNILAAIGAIVLAWALAVLLIYLLPFILPKPKIDASNKSPNNPDDAEKAKKEMEMFFEEVRGKEC